MPRQCRRHPLAVVQADTRHRHQILHRHVRRDPALAHLLLDALRQQLHQRQPPRYPTGAAIEPPRHLLQPVAETLLELLKQPPLFQRRLAFTQPQRAVQHQRLGLAHRPQDRFHRVPAQLLQRRDALVAVNDQVAARLFARGHHHDRRLLARFGQRGQQPALTRPVADPQVLQSPVELVKLQLHRLSRRDHSMREAGTGLSPRQGEVCRQPPSDQLHTPGTGLSRTGAGVCP